MSGFQFRFHDDVMTHSVSGGWTGSHDSYDLLRRWSRVIRFREPESESSAGDLSGVSAGDPKNLLISRPRDPPDRVLNHQWSSLLFFFLFQVLGR